MGTTRASGAADDAPSSVSLDVGAHQAVGSLHESSSRGRAEPQPRRLRSPEIQLRRSDLDLVREVIRFKHYSLRTEEADKG